MNGIDWHVLFDEIIQQTTIIMMVSLYSDRYGKVSVMQGHHIYKLVWTPAIKEQEYLTQKTGTNATTMLLQG